ncbi:TM2 domain-containing protein [Paenibacillus phoenicis]|uniref:TM2 domain-containing protein n=1 Tax=Paenibacillus phoenicis TaxID=554117 RepID=A0ABU5PNL2_9BACL|nr:MULTISPECIES: TM2 domain-containing protein [Paenibacillus]MCT2195824.1 TM2 domain-containing protein [Paenibacillus sp. p3-SID1389]MEA3571422.1 TM2 domain-containing protein [Paenibacillus phoenicis]
MLTKSDLTTSELLLLNSEMNKREKSLGLAYLMLLAGHLGVHRFYLKRIASGVIQLCLFILAIGLYFGFAIASAIESVDSPDTSYSLFLLIPVILFGLALTVWVIVDACLLPGMVRNWNAKLEQSLIEQIAALRSPAGFTKPGADGLGEGSRPLDI